MADDYGEGGRGDARRAGDSVGAEGGEVGDIRKDVDDDEAAGADEESERKGSLRIYGFSGAVGDVLPAFVGPQDADHGEAETGEGKSGGCRIVTSSEDGLLAVPEQDGADDEDGGDFNGGGDVEQVGALARAADVYGGDDQNHKDGNRFCADGRERKKFAHVVAEGDSERGDGAGADDEEKRPAKEKGGKSAEAIANVDVQAAGFGLHRAEFAVRERTKQGKDAAGQPNGESQRNGIANSAQDRTGNQKNAGADNGADDHQHEIFHAEDATQLPRSRIRSGSGRACGQLGGGNRGAFFKRGHTAPCWSHQRKTTKSRTLLGVTQRPIPTLVGAIFFFATAQESERARGA